MPVILGKLDIVLYRRDKCSGNTRYDGGTVPCFFVLCAGQKESDCIDSDRCVYGVSCDIRSGEFYNMRESWKKMKIKSRKATLIIAGLNIFAFIANLVIGGGSFFGLFISGGGYLKEYGEVSFALIGSQGQWWRLLICGYLHMGIIHLAGNLVALKIVGDKAEEKIGPFKLLLLYNFGTVLTAFLWCLIFRNGTIIGASLGIFVLLGIVCVWLLKGKENQGISLAPAEKRYLLVYVIVGCFLGLGTIVVHAIGFVIGLLVGVVMLKMNLRGMTE